MFNIHIAGNVLLELDKSQTHRHEDVVIIVRKKSSMNISNITTQATCQRITFPQRFTKTKQEEYSFEFGFVLPLLMLVQGAPRKALVPLKNDVVEIT